MNDNWEEEHVIDFRNIPLDLRLRADLNESDVVVGVSLFEEVDGTFVLNFILDNETSSMLFDISAQDLEKWGIAYD